MNPFLYNLFSIPVFYMSEFLTKQESKILFDFILNGDLVFKNHGALSGNAVSTYDSQINFLDLSKNKKIKDNIQYCLDNFSEVIGFTKSKISNSWVNIQEKNSLLDEHAHSMSVLSGALYLNVDANSSRLFFSNPNQAISYSAIDNNISTDYNSMFFHLSPNIGDLIIFPSWLRHGSFKDINQTEKRTVISFNTTTST